MPGYLKPTYSSHDRNLQTLNLDNVYNYQYIGTLKIGSQGQPLRLLFDTGSSWLWIPSVYCKKILCTKDHFDFRNSKSFTQTDKYESITYATGAVLGYVANDFV